jgi:hypothetical protein
MSIIIAHWHVGSENAIYKLVNSGSAATGKGNMSDSFPIGWFYPPTRIGRSPTFLVVAHGGCQCRKMAKVELREMILKPFRTGRGQMNIGINLSGNVSG